MGWTIFGRGGRGGGWGGMSHPTPPPLPPDQKFVHPMPTPRPPLQNGHPIGHPTCEMQTEFAFSHVIQFDDDYDDEGNPFPFSITNMPNQNLRGEKVKQLKHSPSGYYFASSTRTVLFLNNTFETRTGEKL